MILKVSVFVIGLCVGAVLSASIDCNIEQCAKPTKIYEELGCKAVYGAKSCCAKRFDCPDFKKLDENKCSFEGREYAIGDVLPRNFTDKCSETCFCTREENEPAKFSCSNSDCGVSSFKVPGCINVYGDLNECCSTSIVCDDEEKETLATCFVGQEYREGEKFIPASNPCYECLCGKGFDNSTITDNPYCRKLNCEIDLRYKSFVQRGCLPVFHSEKCCPVDWECPKQGKKIIKRAAADEESQTVKQDLFIVTPSKNLEGFLDIVKLANPVEIDENSAKLTESFLETVTVPSTESVFIPTLSTNPFEAPIEEVTIPVVVKIDESSTTEAAVKKLTESKDEEDVSVKSESEKPEITTTEKAELKTEIVTEALKTTTESFKKPESSEESSSSSEESSEELTTIKNLQISKESSQSTTESTKSTAETSRILTESSQNLSENSQDLVSSTEISKPTTEIPPTTVTTTEESTTTVKASVSSENNSSSSSSSSESSSSESGEAIFNNLWESNKGQESEEKEASGEVVTPTIPASPSKDETTQTAFVLTTEAPKISARSLESPEELTTLSEKTTSEIPVTEAVATSEVPVTESPSTSEMSTSNEDFTTIKTPVDIESPASSTESATTETVSEPKISIQEVFTSSTEAPSTTSEEEKTTNAPTTPATNPEINITPTEFEKLLTTLREFVAKVESVTSTEAPKTTETPQLEQIVEFVNYTVSSGSEKTEESKSISKRSVSDVDLIPRYYKQHYSSNKGTGCVFNGRSFKLGEPIKTDNDCLKCICEYAPVGHCILKEKCNF